MFSFTVVSVLCLLILSSTIESPQYTSVHNESDFEVRLCRDTAWMTAPAKEISFEKATKDGFHSVSQVLVFGLSQAFQFTEVLLASKQREDSVEI
ncbi:hypothetical protein U1Q18_027375 [Sarracenia purpurea var. burkii]